LGRREEKKQEKRERLESAGLAHFEELGYDRASIEQISAAADVARGTFYLYFADKRALFAALCDRWYVPVRALLEATAARVDSAATAPELLAVYQEMAMGLTMTGVAYGREINVAFREMRRTGEAGDELRRRERELLEIAVGFTRVATERGLIQTRDPRVAAYMVYGASERLYYEMLHGADLGDPVVAAGEALALFTRAFGLGVVGR
jgi:AcrR family transcriptional regulator